MTSQVNLEHAGRVPAVHRAARPASTSTLSARRPITGRRFGVITCCSRPASSRRARRRLSPRNAGRSVHEPVPAGPESSAWREAGPRSSARPRRGQPDVRRHREGDADVEGGRRHGDLHGRQQPDARRRFQRSDRELAFPASVVEFFEGRSSANPSAASSAKELQARVLKGKKPMIWNGPARRCRLIDLEAARTKLAEFAMTSARRSRTGHAPTLTRPGQRRVLRASGDLFRRRRKLPSPAFFYDRSRRGDQCRLDRGGQDAHHQVPDGRRSASGWQTIARSSLN